MVSQKHAAEAVNSSNFNDTNQPGVLGKEEDQEQDHSFSVKDLLWHGGSVYDAWFTCASNQV